MKKDQGEYEIPFREETVKQILQEYKHQTFQILLKDDVIDRALGCLFGSFIGDALGAYLEFAKDKDFDNMMKSVMSMPGGGIFQLKPGQVTDDSELAFHLLDSLSNFQFRGDFKEEIGHLSLGIARGYFTWYTSRPFDIGITCRKSLEIIGKSFQNANLNSVNDFDKLSRRQAERILEQIHFRVGEVSGESQSNGSLMRITPIPFFFSIFSDKLQKEYMSKQLGTTRELMKKFIHSQVKLLHPNKVLVDVSYAWAKMLLFLIGRPSNRQIKQIYQLSLNTFEDNAIGWGKLIDQEPINARRNIGWSKIAVSLGMESLQSVTNTLRMNEHAHLGEELYVKEIKYILSKGGDTDTNAAIVGGMLGALIGFKNLPRKYVTTLMNLKHKTDEPYIKQNRPKFYQPRYAFANAFKLILRRFSKK